MVQALLQTASQTRLPTADERSGAHPSDGVAGCPVERIVQTCDFERVLKSPSTAKTPHFAIHHLSTRPQPFAGKLSTGAAPLPARPVDDRRSSGVWLGYVVPKRHARRAVTRSLLKRQIRAAVQRRTGLAAGLWVVRLRSAFDRVTYPSAASTALARAARIELDGLLARASLRVRVAADASSAPS